MSIIQDDNAVEEFASKIFRYLYLNVFKNNLSDLFKDNFILEEYILNFKNDNDKDIYKILDID